MRVHAPARARGGKERGRANRGRNSQVGRIASDDGLARLRDRPASGTGGPAVPDTRLGTAARGIAAALLLALGGAAQAQRAELLAFEHPASADSPALPPRPGGQAFEEALASASARLAAPVADIPAQAATPRSAGRAFSGVTAGLPGYGPAENGCSTLSYRPRGDLPLTTELRRARLYPSVAQAACEAGLPIGLFDALVLQESRYRVAALSSRGAMGLTQLMPGTARYLAVANPFDPLANLRGGARYLREQLVAFGRVDLALAAYNAGPRRVRRIRAVPKIAETRAYVSSVARHWERAMVRPGPLSDLHSAPVRTGQASARPMGRLAAVFAFGAPPEPHSRVE